MRQTECCWCGRKTQGLSTRARTQGGTSCCYVAQAYIQPTLPHSKSSNSPLFLHSAPFLFDTLLFCAKHTSSHLSEDLPHHFSHKFLHGGFRGAVQKQQFSSQSQKVFIQSPKSVLFSSMPLLCCAGLTPATSQAPTLLLAYSPPFIGTEKKIRRTKARELMDGDKDTVIGEGEKKPQTHPYHHQAKRRQSATTSDRQTNAQTASNQ